MDCKDVPEATVRSRSRQAQWTWRQREWLSLEVVATQVLNLRPRRTRSFDTSQAGQQQGEDEPAKAWWDVCLRFFRVRPCRVSSVRHEFPGRSVRGARALFRLDRLIPRAIGLPKPSVRAACQLNMTDKYANVTWPSGRRASLRCGRVAPRCRCARFPRFGAC
jgi:hypothetical protein